MPHHNTYQRVFQVIISEAEFEKLMGEYHQQHGDERGDVLEMDGKALRGIREANGERGEYVLSVYDGQSQQVLAQEAVGSEENEIAVASKVLERVPLAGKIVTGDAFHTQRAISAHIVGCGSDYLWPVKENQTRLYQDIQHLFGSERPEPGFGMIQTDFQCAQMYNCGHGRIELRSIKTSEMLNDYLDWPGIGQVYRFERTFTWIRQGQAYKSSCKVEFGITSLSRKKASPEKVLAVRRQEWLIETGLPYR